MENFFDQDDIDYSDEEFEDVQKITDDEYFDLIQIENSNQTIKDRRTDK